MLDTFNVSAFPNLANKYEYWGGILESFQFKSFIKVSVVEEE